MENAGACIISFPFPGLNNTFNKGMMRANWNTLKITARIVKIKKTGRNLR